MAKKEEKRKLKLCETVHWRWDWKKSSESSWRKRYKVQLTLKTQQRERRDNPQTETIDRKSQSQVRESSGAEQKSRCLPWKVFNLDEQREKR